jgi:hypothetical protein
MSFNLQQYLTENNLTLIGKAREEAEEPKTSNSHNPEIDSKELQKKKSDLIKLKARVKDIIMKYTIDTNNGRQIKDVEVYKQAVGTIPQQIKNLQQQIDNLENEKPNLNENNNS